MILELPSSDAVIRNIFTFDLKKYHFVINISREMKKLTFLVVAVVILLIVVIVAMNISKSPSPSTGSQADITDLSTNVLAINPPGTNGLVTLSQIGDYLKNGDIPPNTNNELSMYEELLYGQSSLTNSSLTNYYQPETLGVAKSDVASVQIPNKSVGVKILWDKQGIPHVYGSSLSSMAYGAGYAAASSRLFEMDVLRHYGGGTLAGFLGPSCSYEDMDHSQLLQAAYTPQQLQQQGEKLSNNNGALGKDLYKMTQSYVAGINFYIKQADSNKNLMPGLYVALGLKPQPWTITDPILVASLIGDRLGNGGGHELSNANLLNALTAQFGATDAVSIFNALKEQNDPQAPTTISTQFPYMQAENINKTLNVFPDSSNLIGGPMSTSSGCGSGETGNSSGFQLSYTKTKLGNKLVSSSKISFQDLAQIEVASIAIGLNRPSQESNAILVDKSKSADGHPIAVFGPQVGYFSPEILMQEDLHAPDYEAAGVGIPGASYVVEMGRGQNFAWSATSANADNIDQRVLTLCNPNGGPVAQLSTYYTFDGKCVAMNHEDFIETATPTLAGGGVKATIDHSIYFSNTGIVQGWTTVKKQPVAVVDERTTYGHDGDSGLGFLAIGMPSLTYNAKTFEKAASKIVFTFNWFYVGRNNIAYYESGLDPIRPTNFDPNFPTSGSGNASWTGYLSFNGHPHAIDPPSGVLISWNNKPAPMFSANDGQFSYGLVYRSQMLQSTLNNELKSHGGKVTPAQVVQAMESAATTDLTATSELPYVLSLLSVSSNPVASQMKAILTSWLSSGAHRIKANPNDAQYQDISAIVIADEFFPILDVYLFNSLLGGQGIDYASGNVPSGFSEFGQSFVNYPGSEGSAYDGGFEGQVQKLLMQVLGMKLDQPYPPALLAHVCGSGFSNCKVAVNDAFLQTEQELEQINSNSNVSTWVNDSTSIAAHSSISNLDEISFQSIGIIGEPKIPWQNRPTFQQVVNFIH